ncbi:MAG TPA: hypothetical protein VG144_00630, partial [Gaiellaceae bacterium]|nr:hypothetical protein [Gaiellaceae bacterium]
SGCGGGYSNVRIVGNIVDAGGCHSAVSYAYNLMQGGTCAASDRSFSGSYPYVNPVGGTAGDYHVTGGPAVDLVTPSDGDYDLADDIDRQSRPLGAARDAGSDER